MKKIATLVCLLILSSCSTDKSSENRDIEPVDYSAQNEKEITDYLIANQLTAEKSASGLHYIIENQGDGTKPNSNSNVTVSYKGYYLNGSVFDESDEAGLSIGLDRVIRGWTEGISYFNEGGNGVLLIPAHLAYGSYNYNGIPGGSVLIFDVKLLKVD